MLKPGKSSLTSREYENELERNDVNWSKGNVTMGTCPNTHIEKPPTLHQEASNTGDE